MFTHKKNLKKPIYLSFNTLLFQQIKEKVSNRSAKTTYKNFLRCFRDGTNLKFTIYKILYTKKDRQISF